MSKLIYTRVALRVEDDEEDSDEIKKLKGEEEGEPDVWGKGTFLIDEIAGVVEHYPSVEEGPDPEQCNVTFKNGKTWGVQAPYEEIKDILRKFHDGDSQVVSFDTGKAVAVLAHALESDKELFYGYQSNIAMAFVDAWHKSVSHVKATLLPEPKKVHEIANEAAKNFLARLIGSVE